MMVDQAMGQEMRRLRSRSSRRINTGAPTQSDTDNEGELQSLNGEQDFDESEQTDDDDKSEGDDYNLRDDEMREGEEGRPGLVWLEKDSEPISEQNYISQLERD